MNIREPETTGITGMVMVKRALYAIRRRLDRKARRGDRNTPIITELTDSASAVPSSDSPRDFIVKVCHEGSHRECRIHVDEIADDGKPPIFYPEKGRTSFRIVVRAKDRFCQIINRVANCIVQLAAHIRRELNEQRCFRKKGALPYVAKPPATRRVESKRTNRLPVICMAY